MDIGVFVQMEKLVLLAQIVKQIIILANQRINRFVKVEVLCVRIAVARTKVYAWR